MVIGTFSIFVQLKGAIRMFENSGNKIKIWAKVLAFIGILASITTGIVMMSGGMMISEYTNGNAMIWPSLLVIVVGSLASWIASLFMYTFGDIAEQTAAMRHAIDKMQADLHSQLK